VEFRVLGPVEVFLAGRRIEIGHARQRSVLAVLLLDLNQVVPTERLIDRVWGENPPASVRNVLYGYIARLRAALAEGMEPGAVLGRGPGGYRFEASQDQVDLYRFRRQVAEAGTAPGDDDRATLLRAALRLWHGEALAGLSSPWLDATRDRLKLQKTAAVLDLNDITLRQGHHDALVSGLTEDAVAHPADERLIGQLMLALYRSGQQAEALRRFELTRARLADELGIDPSPGLQELHQQILRADPALALPQATSRRGAASSGGRPPLPAVPRHLPVPVRPFAGRVAELRTLDDLLDQLAAGGTMVISAVSGTAGVGKTALALRWAHQVASRFPDGQLYADLRGFGPSDTPVTPAEAIRRFLDALVGSPEEIPPSPEAQQDLYRSMLAGQRMLIMLDNARDAAQIRPLLPGGSGNLVVVTSRSQLTSLAAVDGARMIYLDVLSRDEAFELLSLRLGKRLAAEPQATDKLIGLCARLPLALCIVAARAAAHPSFPLAALAGELQQAGDKLDALECGDAAGSVRAVFSWSLKNLAAPAARLFRLLSVPPGPDVSVAAAASAAGLPVMQARALLRELTMANMLTEHSPGRFAFHDLLRAYAVEQSVICDSETERALALHRVLDYYLHTANAADQLLYSARPRLVLPAPQPGVAPAESFSSHSGTLAWFDAEHEALAAAIGVATDRGFGIHAWQLAWVMEPFFCRRGYWSDWAATQRTALVAAGRLGDRRAQSNANHGIASALIELGEYEDALRHLTTALRLDEEAGDLNRQARTELGISRVFEAQERYQEALAHSQQGLTLSRAAGSGASLTVADALNFVGWFFAKTGNFREAIGFCQQSVAWHRRIGDKHGESPALDSLAFTYRGLGRHAEAADCYRQAVLLYAELGFEPAKATTLVNAGDAYYDGGDVPAARDAWLEALAIFDKLQHRDASEVRARLSGIGANGANLSLPNGSVRRGG
jgi:DNA-binding SARP family transcriptional activator/tetratricopeptide (TPR) repeat protein